ncbi:MAG: pectinesterase family protein [Duganella sp.]
MRRSHALQLLAMTALLPLAALATSAFAATAVKPNARMEPIKRSEIEQIEADAPVRLSGAAAADTYVEARLRPLAGSAGEGRLYVVGRYQDAGNWYGAGINFQPASGRMQVEIVRMQDGRRTRLKQFNRAAPADARFQTVRLEMAGPILTVYLNGERITSVTDDVLALPGQYGIVAEGRAFEASRPVSGSALDKPARLALARAPHSVQLSVGDAALQLPVSALGPYRPGSAAASPVQQPGGFVTPSALQDAAGAASSNGAPVLRFSAAAAHPELLQVQVADGALRLTPRAAGATTVTLTGVDDANVQAVLEVRIAAARVVQEGKNISLAGKVAPAPGERNVPADTPLRLRFDSAPTLGASGGAIRVYRQRDGALVDTIRASGESDLLGYAGQPVRRALRLQPIAIEGEQAIIHLHSDRLQPGQDYQVTVDDGVLQGTVGGRPFAGVSKAQGWRFSTRASAPQGAHWVVDDDGVADFRTVQGALNHAMQHTARTAPVTVEIRNGRYQEQLYLRAKDNLTLRGQSRDGVVIDALNGDGLNPGSGTGQNAQSPGITGGRAIFLIEDADMITLDTLTLRNSTLRDSPNGGQAEAIFFNSEGRLVAKNASFFSEQDTVQVRGYAWFYRTLVAGNVDFIWGNNRAALFEDSELRSIGDSAKGKGGGYLLQARTQSAGDRGFMFVNSSLTHGPGPTGNDIPAGATWLARSPGYATTWDHVAFINCRMGPHIAPAGWAGPVTAKQPAPNPAQATALAGWREYGTMDLAGQPLDLSRRVHGGVLTAEQAAAAYGSRAQFFAGFNGGQGWNPVP